MPVNYIDGATIKGTAYELHDPRTDHKAEIDGSYVDMTVGNAEQLVSTVGVTDKVPYVFRTSGGSADIGDREQDMVVGGSVAWNQQVTNGNFAVNSVWTAQNVTLSISNNVGTVTVSGTNAASRIEQPPQGSLPSGHVVLASMSVKPSNAVKVAFRCDNVTIADGTISANAKSIVSNIRQLSADVAKLRIYVNIDNGLDDGGTAEIENAQLFDLTQMFGSAIADYILSLETATPGAGVAWFRKLFPKSYYPYNAGELMHVQTTAHEMTGFNQWDEEWELGNINVNTGAKTDSNSIIRSKNYIPIIPTADYYLNFWYSIGGNGLKICFYDANKNFISGKVKWSAVLSSSEIPSNTAYMLWAAGVYRSTYENDVCINFHHDGERDGEYEPYILHNYALDSDLVLRGIPKLDSNNALYYDGDVYAPDGTVTRKYGIVDLGTLTWTYNSGSAFFKATVTGKLYGNKNIVCGKYAVSSSVTVGNMVDKEIKGYPNDDSDRNTIYVKDSAYTDAATFKTAMSGVMLVYELATPTTETADPYQTPQVVNNWGAEQYVDAGTRDVEIPVGHETLYRNDLRAKLESAPESPDGNGDYIVRQTNGVNNYVPLVIPAELPSNPSEDGTYVLKATVSNGTTVLSWEVQA